MTVYAEYGKKLSPREREIALLMAQGLLDKEIAHDLNLNMNTIKNHEMAIKIKLGCRTRVEVAIMLYPFVIPENRARFGSKITNIGQCLTNEGSMVYAISRFSKIKRFLQEVVKCLIGKKSEPTL